MSETDDTDVLLLIPPNFFLVHSSSSEGSLLESSRTVVHKPQSCTAQVLGKLVNRVHSLESRLESLEISTSDTFSSLGARSKRKTWDTDSLDSHDQNRKYFTFPRRRRRKVKTDKRDLSLTSIDSGSTYRKFIPPLKLKLNSPEPDIKPKSHTNDTLSMDGDISSVISTPSKNTDKLLLHEIDEFLTKVELYESPESKYKNDQTLCPGNIIKAAGEYISQKLDSKNFDDEVKLPSGRTVPSNILDKYIYLVKNKTDLSSQTDKDKNSSHKDIHSNEIIDRQSVTSKTHDSSKNMHEKSPSIRKLNFSDSKDVQPTSTPKKPLQPSTSYLDNFRPTSNKIYDRAAKILEQYKSQNGSHNTQNLPDSSYSFSPKKEFKMPEMRPYVPENRERKYALENKLMDTIDTDLLSLSELWGEKGERMDRVDNNRLEEERLKREHCEAMIQQLQKKVLEQQEKLAVAIKVDRAKDAAITKLREAWLKITGSLDRAEERHKSALEKILREVENFKTASEDAQKKSNHFETELYKALDLAHDYKDKCKQLGIEKKELQDNMEQALASKEEIIKSKDKEIELLKGNYETIMRLNKQSTDCVRNLEDTLEKERTEHEITKSKVNELNRRIQSDDEQTSLLYQERDLLKEKVNEERARCNIIERQLCEKQNQCSDLLKKCDNLDSEVKSLHKLIELQKNELKVHYQKQLEEAVLAKLQEFQQQLDQAEREMESDARSKENAIVDTFNKQIIKIEEQHKLEIKVLEEKQREEIKLYRLQLAQASEKISLLESKLDSLRRRRGQLASQLHSVMEAQWRQALLILTGAGASAPHTPLPAQPTAGHGNQTADNASSLYPDIASRLAAGSLSLPAPGDRPPPAPAAPPTVPSNAFNVDGLSDNELQHYVKMLLTKPVNLDGSGDSASPDKRKDVDEEPTSDRPDRHDRPDRPDRKERTAKRAFNTSKPPWKA